MRASERRRRSHSSKSVRLPDAAMARARASAIVDFPSSGTVLVTTTVHSGSSTPMNPMFA